MNAQITSKRQQSIDEKMIDTIITVRKVGRLIRMICDIELSACLLPFIGSFSKRGLGKSLAPQLLN